MTRRIFLGCILILFGLLGSGSTRAMPATAAPTDEAFTTFAREMEQLRQALHIPGMSVAIVQDQELVWAQGFGQADMERGIPATADTPYHFASVTKPFAATLLLQLVEAGQLSLDEPASQYGIHLQHPDITVRHLLTHTSDGIPGSAHNYDGNRYGLLARVFKGVTGQSFGQLLSERFLLPLDMSHTAPNTSWAWGGIDGYLATMGIGDRYEQIPLVYQQMARPYQFDATYENIPGTYPLHFSPAAGLIGSVTDIAKFDIALDTDQLLRPETKAAMFSPTISNSGQPLIYGLGWYTQNVNGTRLIWHSGGWSPSVSALYLKVPDENLTFIVLANNYNLTRPYPLGEGDVLYSTPALTFYERFVFPRQTGKQVPAIDWTASQTAILAQLQTVTDPEVRTVLERELWSYRKLFGSVGQIAQAERLLRVHRVAFPELTASRVGPVTVGINDLVPQPQPVGILPHQIVMVDRLLLIWLTLTVICLITLLIDFWQGAEWPRPWQVSWLLLTALFGSLGLAAYLAAGGHNGRRYPTLPAWRQAQGLTLFRVTGNILGLLLGLLVVYIWFPDAQGAPAAILGMFLCGWLVFYTPMAAWATGNGYVTSLRRTFLPSLGGTFFTLLGVLPAMIFLLSFFQEPLPDDPLFLAILVPTAIAGALFVYPYTVWLIRRQRHGVADTRPWPPLSLPGVGDSLVED